MLSIYIDAGNHSKLRIADVCTPITGRKILENISNELGHNSDLYFLKNNGSLIGPDDVVYNGDVLLEPKLCGGKGGFGSMLRAIGAQIEKTTNREACRDLSGRRLRDINEEKRLKAWIEKQGNRDEEAAERKKRKLAKLCAEPKHEFKDKSYEKERSELTERVEDAVEVGFAAASSSGIKRVADPETKTNLKKKKKTILDDDIDSDDLDSSSDEDEGEVKKVAATSSKSENENSSDNVSSRPESSNEEENSKSSSPKSSDEGSR